MASDMKSWSQESCDLRDDPVSGARIIQLTSAADISNNVYGEQPYCSPDGKRLVIVRMRDYGFDDEASILVHELDSLRIHMAVRKLHVGVRYNIFNNAWSGLIYYWTARRELMRLSLMTLKQEVVFVQADPQAPLPRESVAPDQRSILGVSNRLTGPGAPVFQLIRLDLQTGRQEPIFEHPYILTHVQHNPVTGSQILIQNNTGVGLLKDGSFDYTASTDCKLLVIDADGGNPRYLPMGRPQTLGGTGHECFVADTQKVLFSVGWQRKSDYEWHHDDRWPQGNLFTAKPGDDRPTPFPAPEHRFNHVSASRCGRYFVADSYTGPGLFENGRIKPCALVVGNLQTGKHRVLVQDSQASGGGNQCTHTHPYFTADNRHVIYNADPNCSTPQVFAAKLAPGFLESLE